MSGQVGEIIVREIPNENLGGVATSAFAELTYRSAADFKPSVDLDTPVLPSVELRYAGSLVGSSEVGLGDLRETHADIDQAIAA